MDCNAQKVQEGSFERPDKFHVLLLKLLLHFLDVYMMMNVLPPFVLKNSVSLMICNNFLRIAVHD